MWALSFLGQPSWPPLISERPRLPGHFGHTHTPALLLSCPSVEDIYTPLFFYFELSSFRNEIRSVNTNPFSGTLLAVGFTRNTTDSKSTFEVNI
jgi:hypothetical protein